MTQLIRTLLNDLIAKEYIYQIYNPKTAKASSIPAIYYIARLAFDTSDKQVGI